MSLNPFRTSLSTPRMPRLSWLPSTVDSTDRRWMPRFWATDATPAVRQLASPTRRYSIGVIPLSEAAKTSGWSASNTASVLWLCSAPRPKKFWIDVVLWTPCSHLDDAFHVNWAASGAPARTSRASRSAWTLTPLSITVIAPHPPLAFQSKFPTKKTRQYTSVIPTATAGAGSVGTVATLYLELPNPVRLDCGRELHPV